VNRPSQNQNTNPENDNSREATTMSGLSAYHMAKQAESKLEQDLLGIFLDPDSCEWGFICPECGTGYVGPFETAGDALESHAVELGCPLCDCGMMSEDMELRIVHAKRVWAHVCKVYGGGMEHAEWQADLTEWVYGDTCICHECDKKMMVANAVWFRDGSEVNSLSTHPIPAPYHATCQGVAQAPMPYVAQEILDCIEDIDGAYVWTWEMVTLKTCVAGCSFAIERGKGRYHIQSYPTVISEPILKVLRAFVHQNAPNLRTVRPTALADLLRGVADAFVTGRNAGRGC